jgi:hypothetical protein
MSLGSALLKRMLATQLKDVPEPEREKIITVIEKNPQLFQTLAQKVQKKMKAGVEQRTALMEVMREHENELKDLMK